MKCRFFLLDLDEDRQAQKPSVRLWGIDDAGKRVLVQATKILPYLYYLPEEKDNLESIKDQLEEAASKLPNILGIEIETRKLLGNPRRVLRINCNDSQALMACAKGIRKLLGKGQTFEEDLRLSVRYITDSDLTPCGWHECDGDALKAGGVEVERAWLARGIPTSVVKDATPSLRILAFTLLTAGDGGSARPEKDPVRAIAVATSDGKTHTFVTEGGDDSKLFSDFIALFHKFDPDIIAGFESNNAGWPYLIQRSKARKSNLAIGRDGSEPHTSVFGHVSIAGRASLDLFDIASGIPKIKLKTIENSAKYLQIPSAVNVKTMDEYERYELWKEVPRRPQLIENTRANARALMELTEAVINYPMQLSSLTGLPLDQIMSAANGFRVDSYLIKQAHKLGELIPARVEQPYYTYRGALVLEPQTGIHESIVVLDFTSMYPSLMKQYNLSPDTLVKPGEKLPDDSVFLIPEVGHRFRKEPDGFYRTVLETLIQQRIVIREEISKLGEKSTRFRVLKERERAIKVITNACYGYAGWAGARWYSKEVAESATALGRETITKTIEKAESLGLRVIYGDTDSIFVKDDRNKVNQLIDWAERELKLDIKREREYVRILFTEAMKRYAGLLKDGSLDVVGLEVVRGDWSELAHQVQELVLTSILIDQSTEKAVEGVRGIINRLRQGEVPMTDLTIRKTLTKPIEDYAVRTPHVEVAKLLVKQGWDIAVGDKVAYVVMKGPGKLFQKAKPPSQVKPQDVDIEYYLDNQVKPAAMRILERFAVNEAQLLA